MTDPATVAKGLTKAQREIFEFLPVGSALPAWALRADHLGVKAAADIRKMPGLFEKVDMSRFGSQHWWYRYTPLGLAVRNLLEKEQ